VCRLAFRSRHPKERGLLAGASAGGSNVSLAAYPLAAACFGPWGLRLALLAGAANLVANWVLGYVLFATAGAAFPEQYQHQDGGTYRGEWLGMLKQGYGIYTYPSGARYEGGWPADQAAQQTWACLRRAQAGGAVMLAVVARPMAVGPRCRVCALLLMG
jgi:predicted permease